MNSGIDIQLDNKEGNCFPMNSDPRSADCAGKFELRRPQNLSGVKILLAEDSADNAFLVSSYLKNSGCLLEFAENGREAVEKFASNDFDLVLMDMQMPEMDGYSATRWIRILEKKKIKSPFVIALTAYAMKEEIEKSLAAGCNLHLNKPITKLSLLNAIAAAFAEETPIIKAIGT